MEINIFKSFMALKQTFGLADYVRPYTVFNISGNKYRLIALIDYNLSSALIREILPHKEYDRGNWRK